MKIIGQNQNLEELFEMYESKQSEFEEKLRSITFSEFLFKLKARMEHFNDDNRIRTQAFHVSPINASDYGNILLNKIRD